MSFVGSLLQALDYLLGLRFSMRHALMTRTLFAPVATKTPASSFSSNVQYNPILTVALIFCNITALLSPLIDDDDDEEEGEEVAKLSSKCKQLSEGLQTLKYSCDAFLLRPVRMSLDT